MPRRGGKDTGRPSAMSHDLHESLRDNVRILGDSLGRTIADDLGGGFVDKIEAIRGFAKRGRQGDGSSQRELIDYLRQLPDRDLLPVTRAFNQFLNLANIAEQHRSEEHTSELQSRPHLVCRLLLEK